MIASLRCSQRLALPKADDDEEQVLNLPDLFSKLPQKEMPAVLRARGANSDSRLLRASAAAATGRFPSFGGGEDGLS